MLKVAFYIGKPQGFYEHVVRVLTGKRTHCELVLLSELEEWDFKQWVSASPRDGGVKSRRVDFNAAHWELIEIPHKLVNYLKLTDFIKVELGCKYDWLGVLMGWAGIQSKNRWYCSEFCTAALKAAGLDLKIRTLCTPEQLYKALKQHLEECEKASKTSEAEL